jgi:hypothetical protein
MVDRHITQARFTVAVQRFIRAILERNCKAKASRLLAYRLRHESDQAQYKTTEWRVSLPPDRPKDVWQVLRRPLCIIIP